MNQALYDLPEGWEWVRLGDYADIQSGVGFPPEFQGNLNSDIPFLKVSDMNLPENSKEIRSWNNSISNEIAQTLRAKIMPSGTVIFPKVGAAIGTNKKRILLKPSVFDNNVMGIYPKEKIHNSYLFWYFHLLVHF